MANHYDDDDDDRNDYRDNRYRNNDRNYRDDSDDYRDRNEAGASLLKNSVGVDKAKGTINVFGKTVTVGPLGYILDPLYEKFMLEVSVRGGNTLEKLGKGAASFVTKNKSAQNITGGVIGGAWRYGALGWDIALDTSKTIRNGIRDARDNAALLEPYLKANHKSGNPTTLMMSDDNPGVQNLRKAILARSKAEMIKHFTALVTRAPSLMLSYWSARQQQYEAQEGFKDKTHAVTDVHKSNGIAYKIAEFKTSAKFKDWESKHPGRGTNEYFTEHPMESFELFKSVGAKDAVRSLFNPTYEETILNQGFASRAPYVTGLIKQFTNEQFANKRIDREDLSQFAVVRIARLAASLKKTPCEDTNELIEEIKGDFIQHFKDSGFKYDAAKLDRKLTDLSAELAKAITQDDLNPYALIDLVCGNTLVKYHDGALEFVAHHDRKDIIEQQAKKYTSTVDNKEFYKEAHVKPEDLKKIYDALDPEERTAFVMIIPAGVLEQQGVNKRELKDIRRANHREFMEQVTQFFGSLKDVSSKDLATRTGISEKDATHLLSLAEDFNDAQSNGEREADKYLKDHKNDISVALVHATASAKHPKLLQALVGKRGASAERDGGDPATDNEESDEHRSRATRRRPVRSRSLKEYANEQEDAGRSY